MKLKKDVFEEYRKHVIGYESGGYLGVNGEKTVYADWCGTGKMYDEIEREILQKYGLYYSNLHSVGNPIAEFMETEYFSKRAIVKKHFGADEEYELIENAQGMTTATNQFIEIVKDNIWKPEDTVVLVSVYEHNSNYITWLKHGYMVDIIGIDHVGMLDLNHYEKLLEKYRYKNIIVSITACSNVVGVLTDVNKISKIGKKYGALVFVDYTACAPYVRIDVKASGIDGMVCSIHKFVGGVQGIGVLILKKEIYKRSIPTRVGGGTVRWVSPYKKVLYKEDINSRELAGTAPILQMIKSGLAIQLKEEIGIDLICERERCIADDMARFLNCLDGVNLFVPDIKNRLPFFSFVLKNEKYTETVRKLCGEYNIQVRGGCCCASLFMHYIFGISKEESNRIWRDLSKDKEGQHQYGWVRISLNYLTSDQEIQCLKDSLQMICKDIEK